MKRPLAAFTVAIAIVAASRTARPLVPEAERLTGADLPAKHLVVTIDQGPSATTTELAVYLRQQKVRATFFVDNRYSAAKPTLTAIAAEDHLLGNRAGSNRDLVREVPRGELEGEVAVTDALIAPLVPWNRKVFRAPFGSWTNLDAGFDANPDGVYEALATTKANDYVGPIYWNIDADCAALDDTACATAYLQRARARSSGIVRFDDTAQTLAVVKLLVPKLAAEGYVFEALDDVPAVKALFAKCDATCAGCTGPTANDCNMCPEGARLFQGQCTACNVCQPGSYVVKTCIVEADTLCAPCPANTYQPAPGVMSCLTCGDCSDGDACTTDTCDAVQGCTHTKIPNCPLVIDAGNSPIFPDAGTKKPGGLLDDHVAIPVSPDEDEGCSIRHGTHGSAGLVVALCIAGSLRRRRRKRPLSSTE